MSLHYEDLCIDIKSKGSLLTLGSIYKHPLNVFYEIDKFSAYTNKTFHNFNSTISSIYNFRRLNIDLTQLSKDNSIRKYVDTLISSACKCLIFLPITIKATSQTLIDHIYSNDPENAVSVGILNVT